MDKYKSLLMCLIFTCPMEEELENCPFKNLRVLDIKKRIDFIYSLSINDAVKLYSHHQFCLLKREDFELTKITHTNFNFT